MNHGERIPIDFHIYVDEQPYELKVILDKEDPQREELMRALAEVFEKHGRLREADECLHIGIKG